MDDDKKSDNEALVYAPSKVSWATAEFVRVPPSLTARSFIYIFSLTLLLGALYAGFGRVAVSVESRGSIVTERPIYTIKASVNFKVGKIMAVNDQTVKAADVLLVSEDQVSDHEYKSILADMAFVKQTLQSDLNGNCADCLARLEVFSGRAFRIENKPQLREILSPAQELIKELATAKSQLQNLSSVTMSLHRQIEVARKKLAEIRRRKSERILALDVEQLNSEIISGQTQIADKTQVLETQIRNVKGRLEVQLEGLLADVDRYRSQRSVVAPSDGIVTHLKAGSVGQYFTAGDDLLELVPQDSGLQAELLVANKDISRVRPDLAVRIKLDALPDREFGALNGKVKLVPGVASSTSGPDEYFKVRVQLDRQSLRKGSAEYPFKVGMSLTGYVITEYQSLLTLGIRKLFNFKDEAFKD